MFSYLGEYNHEVKMKKILAFLILCASSAHGAIHDLADTFYSQVSPSGKVLTNAEDMGIEIDKIYINTKKQKLSESEDISLDAFYLYLTNKIYSGDKLSSSQVKALEDKRNEMLAYMKENPVDSAFITILADIGFVMSTRCSSFPAGSPLADAL